MSTILVVDDHGETLALLFTTLRAAGYGVLTLNDGENALEQAATRQPDLILLDVMLPGRDGFQICRALQANPATREIPVIFMTGLTEITDKMKGFEAGGVDYLTKPFQCAEVIMRVKTHLLLRRFQQQLQDQNALLEEQKLRFQMLSEATVEGIVIHAQGMIADVNQAFETMFGVQRPAVIGQNLLEYVTPAFHEIVRQHILTNDDSPYEIEMRSNSGLYFPVVVHAKTMMAHGRQIRVASLRDISWRKALEQEKARLEQENLRLKLASQDRYKFGDIIGKSPAMQELYEAITQAAAADASVIIFGESGVGKELVAQTIHRLSDRRDHEFVPVNCAAIPENLFEREFFGHRKGAFTGADRDQAGYFDHAHQGTLFLDEIGELPPSLQVKLLRAMEQGEYLPVGSHTPKRADVRIVAATHRDLETELRHGRIREDFFFRVHVITITIPPLRARKEDLPLLIDFFLAKLRRGKPGPLLPEQVVRQLYQHDWPGNVRELQNVLHRYLTLGRLEFPGSKIPAPPPPDSRTLSQGTDLMPVGDLQDMLDAFEKQCLRQALEQHHWNKGQTAQALGLERKTLYRKMKKFGLG